MDLIKCNNTSRYSHRPRFPIANERVSRAGHGRQQAQCQDNEKAGSHLDGLILQIDAHTVHVVRSLIIKLVNNDHKITIFLNEDSADFDKVPCQQGAIKVLSASQLSDGRLSESTSRSPMR